MSKNLIFILLVTMLIITGCSQQTVAEQISEKLALAEKYIMEKDFEQAILAYEDIIEIDPKFVEAYIGLANVYKETEQFEKVEDILNKGIDSIPNEETLLRTALAQHFFETDKTDEAIMIYKQLIDSDKLHMQAYDRLIEIYKETGDFEELEKLLLLAKKNLNNMKYIEELNSLSELKKKNQLVSFYSETDIGAFFRTLQMGMSLAEAKAAMADYEVIWEHDYVENGVQHQTVEFSILNSDVEFSVDAGFENNTLTSIGLDTFFGPSFELNEIAYNEYVKVLDQVYGIKVNADNDPHQSGLDFFTINGTEYSWSMNQQSQGTDEIIPTGKGLTITRE